MKPIWHRKFKDWKSDDVIKTFGLVRVEGYPMLNAWLEPKYNVPENLVGWVEDRRQELIRLQYGWNEAELMMRFIAPILTTVGFTGENHNLFFHRPMSLELEVNYTAGTVDGMVSMGIHDPSRPFFFLNEYKKSQGYQADPEGQLLIAMIAAQSENNDNHPVYGCFVIGTFWRFVLLDGQQLAISQGYDATDPIELQIIWSVLCHTREIIEKRVEMLIEDENV